MSGGARGRAVLFTAGARAWAAMLCLFVAAAGCLPKAGALEGTPFSGSLPDSRLRGPQRIVFEWAYDDEDFRARGEGVAEIVPPDSAGLQLFLRGGILVGMAQIAGDSVVSPASEEVARLLPPPAFFWAAVGRLSVVGRDTVARVDGDVLRAEIGPEPRWRTAFTAGRLVRLERIEKGRITEWVVRETEDLIRYRHEGARRSLVITIVRPAGGGAK